MACISPPSHPAAYQKGEHDADLLPYKNRLSPSNCDVDIDQTIQDNSPWLQIHTPIDRLLQNVNEASLDLMLSAFASSAEIVDDGKSLAGDAIRAFCEHGMIGHRASVKVLEQQVQNDGRSYIHIIMDGDCGKEFGIHEPFDLILIATIDNDKIQHLEMGDIDPKRSIMSTVHALVGSPTDPLSSVRITRRNILALKE
jgi:hypothetical protein